MTEAEKPRVTPPAWLSSSVVAAMVTVLGSALVGNIVTNAYQSRAKRNDAVLQYLKDKRAARDATVSKALQITGGYVTAIEDLIHSTSSAFRSEGRDKEETQSLETWKAGIRNAHDKADADWRRERDTTGFTLALHDTENSDLHKHWTSLAASVDQFEECGRNWYMQHATGDEAFDKSPCTSQRVNVNTAMLDMLSVLREAERKFFEAQLNR